MPELRDALAGAEPGIGVVHVPIVRDGARELADLMARAVRAAVDGALSG